MRAAVSERYGGADVVVVQEVAAPVPGDDEILIRVDATTVNRTDCAYRAAHPFFMRAWTGLRRPTRTVLGTEFAGVVVGAGAGVDRFAVGDRVFGYCEGRFGAHAELLVVSQESMVATVPEGIDQATAAAATEGSHYAASAIRRSGVRAGDRVLVIGATGGIGSAAVQLLVAAGAVVTAVCPAAHVELVRGLGAAEVVALEDGDVTRSPRRFDVVIDAVGKRTFRDARRILEPRGIYVSSELGPGWQNIPLSLLGLVRRNAQRVVFPVPDEGRPVIERIREHLAAGTFRPVIDRTYPLEQIIDAYRYVETGQKVGNVVIEVRPAS
ncbi:NAD(P)-dependent alcohol dehydrogenase [Agrococcus beijingensis]|uniref:NAD(P)-dependent alcohol dehydrogenase n=1 Tax=Agrococcus beijingensis TaxID=3068634 RepID=UPI0027409AD1|nr:NAD(P)-dependent alcohol dehydrogenase [Agrococcus sp. REN33]